MALHKYKKSEKVKTTEWTTMQYPKKGLRFVHCIIKSKEELEENAMQVSSGAYYIDTPQYFKIRVATVFFHPAVFEFIKMQLSLPDMSVQQIKMHDASINMARFGTVKSHHTTRGPRHNQLANIPQPELVEQEAEAPPPQAVYPIPMWHTPIQAAMPIPVFMIPGPMPMYPMYYRPMLPQPIPVQMPVLPAPLPLSPQHHTPPIDPWTTVDARKIFAHNCTFESNKDVAMDYIKICSGQVKLLQWLTSINNGVILCNPDRIREGKKMIEAQPEKYKNTLPPILQGVLYIMVHSSVTRT